MKYFTKQITLKFRDAIFSYLGVWGFLAAPLFLPRSPSLFEAFRSSRHNHYFFSPWRFLGPAFPPLVVLLEPFRSLRQSAAATRYASRDKTARSREICPRLGHKTGDANRKRPAQRSLEERGWIREFGGKKLLDYLDSKTCRLMRLHGMLGASRGSN